MSDLNVGLISHHRKRVDGQINDGEERSEKKKNEVLSLARFS